MSHENASSMQGPLTRNQITARVIPILAEEAGMSPDDLRDSHLLEDDLGFDSLTLVESSMELEEEFDVEISDEAAEGMKTVGDVIEGMCKLLEGQNA
jgi:acyl carrier protein